MKRVFILLTLGLALPLVSHAACEPGCYESSGACEPCPTHTFNNDGGACNACPAGETGNIITGATSCVAKKTLMSGNGYSAILRAVQTTHPSLAVQINGDPNTYYANLAAGLSGAFRLNYGGADYSTVDVGKDPATCGMPHGTFLVTLNAMPASSQFSLEIAASGSFTIDWGLGTAPQVISKPDTTNTMYTSPASPKYSGGPYTVTISGLATGYPSNATAAISFFNSTNRAGIVAIAGDLSSIFPIVNSSSTGVPRFVRTFCSCANLVGAIPPNLFASLSGPPATYMFYGTFQSCPGLTGTIPSNLFAGITGPPMGGIFINTFQNCKNLVGEIPGNLFAGISGAPANQMFYQTFAGATGLTSIGAGLFDGISGAAQNEMFVNTFNGCTGLTGPSATTTGGNGVSKPIYQEWPAATTAQVGGCYTGATKLSDWNTINTSFPNWR